MLLWIFKFRWSLAEDNGNGPAGFSCKSKTKAWPILAVERTAILMWRSWTAKSKPAALNRATGMKGLSAFTFFVRLIDYFFFPWSLNCVFLSDLLGQLQRFWVPFFLVFKIPNVLMVKNSFFLFGSFIPTQMFSSVYLNYFNKESCTLGKARSSPSYLL